MANPLVKPGDDSDAGGVAARRGFRFQDHVAASLAIDMLENSHIEQIECETGDDIVVRYLPAFDVDIEYVQVKITDDDAKWSISELTERKDGKANTSICERSLLCDQHGGRVRFRMLTKRDVRKDLKPFCTPWTERSATDTKLASIQSRVGSKWKATKSASGRTLIDWAKALHWQVEPSEDSLKSSTINRMLRLAQGFGPVPSWSIISDIYEKLLRRVAGMADASRTKPKDKCWSRFEIQHWWKDELFVVAQLATSTIKVYRTPTEAFFSEFHARDDQSEKRSLHSFDVEYDGDSWRREELVEYLIEWIPEISLPPSILATFNHLQGRRLSTRARQALSQNGVNDDGAIIANLMLHCILRHHYDSEPIACKIYYSVGGTMRDTNAHIVATATGDELWLGRSHLVTASDYKQTVANTVSEIKSSLDPSLLKEDRDIIIRLREPNHLRPDSLANVLNEKGKISDLTAVLRLPILVAYDSTTLSGGFDSEYLAKLIDEVNQAYDQLKPQLGDNLAAVDIVIFLIPIECCVTLKQEFSNRLRGK